MDNPKFNFLNSGDPYHSYYQHKVKEFEEGKGQEPSVQKGVTPAAQQKQQEILKQVEQPFIPKDPPTEFEFIADPPSISASDLLVENLITILFLLHSFIELCEVNFLIHL